MFFSGGVTSTRLNDDEIVPVEIDRFKIRVFVLAIDSIFSLRFWVWLGSRPHVLDGDNIMTPWIFVSDTSSKDVRWSLRGTVCKFSTTEPPVAVDQVHHEWFELTVKTFPDVLTTFLMESILGICEIFSRPSRPYMILNISLLSRPHSCHRNVNVITHQTLCNSYNKKNSVDISHKKSAVLPTFRKLKHTSISEFIPR